MMESFTSTQACDLDALKDIPGYKAILKTLIKSQIQHLVQQLSGQTGEEAVFLTVSTSDGSLSHLGSDSGKDFLNNNEDIKSKFLGFCLQRQHMAKKAEEKEAVSSQAYSPSPSRGPSPRVTPYPVPRGGLIRNRPKHVPMQPMKHKPISSTISSGQSDIDNSNHTNTQVIDTTAVVKTENVPTSEDNMDNAYSDQTIADTNNEYTSEKDSSSQNMDSSFSGMSANIKSIKSEPGVDEDLSITGVELGDGASANQMQGTADWLPTSEAYMQNQSMDSAIMEDKSSIETSKVNDETDVSLNMSVTSENETDTDTIQEPTSSDSNLKPRKSYYCKKCSYSSFHRPNLSRHTRAVHLKHKFDCKDCGNKFSSQYDLREHDRSQHQNISFLCEFCSKSFKSRKTLSMHKIKAHSTQKGYVCHICSKTMHDKAHFEGHVNAHLESKPFACTTCPKSFSYKSSLSKHNTQCKGKDNLKKYMCSQCDTVLSSLSNLRDHEQGKHGQDKKSCLCGKTFAWRTSFTRHKKTCKFAN